MKGRGAAAKLLAAWGLAVLLVASTPSAQAQTPTEARLELLWLWPAPRVPPRDVVPADVFGIYGLSALSDGSIAISGWSLTTTGRRIPLLLTQAQSRGPEGAMSRPLALQRPSLIRRLLTVGSAGSRQDDVEARAVMRFVVAPQGDIWGVGASRSGSNEHCEQLYLTRLRADRMTVWQRHYTCMLPSGIVLPRDGGAVVLASHWVGRVGPDGRLISERRLAGRAIAEHVLSLQRDRFLIIGIDDQQLSTWLLTESNELVGPHRIRKAIGRNSIENVTASATADGAYITSSLAELPVVAPLEVARVRARGEVVWRQTLLATSIISARFEQTCRPALATLPSGDALLACTVAGVIHLYRLAQEDGTPILMHLPLPDCHSAKPELFPAVAGEALFLAGSQAAPGCSWLARLHL